MHEYCVSDEDKAKIQETFKVTHNDVKLQVKLLKEWTVSRSDLPVESQDEDFINLALLRSKFREDTAKIIIERYYSCIRKYPEIFQHLGKFKLSDEIGVAVYPPKLTPRFEMVAIFKLLPRNIATKPFDMYQLVLSATTTILLMHNYVYSDTGRSIFDFEHVSVMHFFKLRISELHKLLFIVRNMLKLRISGIEIINASSVIHLILRIAKIVLSKKLQSRITIHNDLASLHKNVPIECLPSDYGGEAESTEQLVEKWDHIVESHQSFFQKISDLSQRDDGNKNSEV